MSAEEEPPDFSGTPPSRVGPLFDRALSRCGYSVAMADPMAAAVGVQPEPASTVDYRLVRAHVLQRVLSGTRMADDVCDAHPELVRAGREVGTAANEPCPVCQGSELALVSYVFGPRLPAHGRCISYEAEIAKLARRKGRFTCYEVEVCPDCRWNHLLRSYVLKPG